MLMLMRIVVMNWSNGMKNLNLQGWALIAEIVGTIAVVISLLFVAYSINYNTGVLQSVNDNLLYDYNNLAIDDVVHDASMAAILVKLENSEDLSEIEMRRFESYQERFLTMWELAHDRYIEGLFPEQKWLGWSDALANNITQGPTRLPKERWINVRAQFGPEFAKLMDAAYTKVE
jgi:hypothetical protein